MNREESVWQVATGKSATRALALPQNSLMKSVTICLSDVTHRIVQWVSHHSGNERNILPQWHVSWVTWHTLQSCVRRHSGMERNFMSDVSHIAQSCVTCRSGNVLSRFLEWCVTHSTILWIETQKMSESSFLCDTSLRKWAKQFSWVTCHTLHNPVWYITQERAKTISWVMCITSHNHVWHATQESMKSWVACHIANSECRATLEMNEHHLINHCDLIIVRPTGVCKKWQRARSPPFENVWRTFVRLGRIMIKRNK